MTATGQVLAFLGGAGTVTGSRFLIKAGESRLLVDCGLYQGIRELRRRNWDPLSVPPADIDGIVLSHAHLDHCGYLPVLVRDGFSGPIFATSDTTRLAALVLRDSAHIQEEDAAHAERRGYSKHAKPKPLYTGAEVEATLRHLRPVAFRKEFEVAGAEVVLRPAGHILGSATVHVALAGGRTVLFTGDLGRPAHPVLVPPDPAPPADTFVVESTYGDREHDDAGAQDRLAAAITRTVERGGSVLIPAFAVDRTEVVLRALRTLRQKQVIPDVPVFVDSPMALSALDLYRKAVADGATDVQRDIDLAGDPFDTGWTRELRTVQESMTVNEPATPCIVISASGMATGGRVLHHLAHLLPRRRNTVVLTGYQAMGTRGRALADGASELKLLGRYVSVRAEVVDLPAFSVHADADEIVSWLSQVERAPDVCYLVHGEPTAAQSLRRRIGDELGWTVVVPRHEERVRLD